METVEGMHSAMTPKVPVCPAARVESAAHETRCVAQETAAAMVKSTTYLEKRTV